MCHPRATVVCADEELVEAERAHQLDLILRHHPFGIIGMIRQTGRFGAVAVAAQVSRDHVLVLCQRRRDVMPDHMGLRMAMQQQHGAPLPVAAMHGVDRVRLTAKSSVVKPGKNMGALDL